MGHAFFKLFYSSMCEYEEHSVQQSLISMRIQGTEKKVS